MIKLLIILFAWISVSVTFAQPIALVNLQPGSIITLPVGAAPSALAIADYNQDNRADIAVCQRGLNSVGVYLQAASGGFPSTPAGTYATGQAPSGLVAVPLGQYPARPYIDLVAVSGPSNTYTLLTNSNNGSGTFTPVANGPSGNRFGQATDLVSPQLLARDLDGNGWIDFAYSLDPTVFVRDGGAYWQRLVSATRVATSTQFNRYQTGYRASSLALDDFNRDGVTDVVMTNPAGNQFTVVIAQLNSGAPDWNAASSGQLIASSGIRPVFVATGDVNGDLLPDIALAHEGSSEITLFLNSRTAGFGTPGSYPLSAAPRQVLLQDLNNDRLPEMLVLTADNKLQVFQHTGAAGLARYGTPIVLPTGSDPVTMQLADVDGDFLTDVVVGCAGDNTVRVYVNRSGVLATRTPRLTGVDVYPNPAQEQVTVRRTASLRGPLTATLVDALGRQVRRTEIFALTTSIPVADLPRGVYVLQLTTTEGVMNQRLVIEP